MKDHTLMRDALTLIISKSPGAMREAIKCLQAIGANSSIVQQRYNYVVDIALNDQHAGFTAKERTLIASYLDIADTAGSRNKLVQIRVTAQEKADLEIMAAAAGFRGDVSAWTRHLWGLE